MVKRAAQTAAAPQRRLSERPPVIANVTAEEVGRASLAAGEPEWLAHARADLLAHFRRSGLPGPAEEEWRGSNLRAMGLGALPVRLPNGAGGGLVSFEPNPALSPLLDEFARDPDGAHVRLNRAYDPADLPPLVALNGALFSDGVFCRFAGDMTGATGRTAGATGRTAGATGGMAEGAARAPLQVRIRPPAGEAAVFPRNVVIVEEGSRAELIEEFQSPPEGGPVFCNSVTEVFVGPGASADVLTLIEWDATAASCHRAVARVSEGGRLRWYIGTAGGGFARADVEVHLDGPGAESRIVGIGLGEGDRRLDHRTVQSHLSGETLSRIDFGTLLWGRSSSIYRGMIRMRPGAILSDAYQKNDNLLLSGESAAQAIPKLEILADDVKCSHGSTVGRLSDEDLFYLQSRGISAVRARTVIAGGFVRRVLASGGEWTPLVEHLYRALADRIAALADGAARSEEERF